MNIVVRPDGTAEIDSRDAADIAEELFPSGTGLTLNLRTDDGVVEGAALVDPASEPVNGRARRMVAALTGVHIVFNGTVLLTALNPEDAVELLTIE